MSDFSSVQKRMVFPIELKLARLIRDILASRGMSMEGSPVFLKNDFGELQCDVYFSGMNVTVRLNVDEILSRDDRGTGYDPFIDKVISEVCKRFEKEIDSAEKRNPFADFRRAEKLLIKNGLLTRSGLARELSGNDWYAMTMISYLVNIGEIFALDGVYYSSRIPPAGMKKYKFVHKETISSGRDENHFAYGVDKQSAWKNFVFSSIGVQPENTPEDAGWIVEEVKLC